MDGSLASAPGRGLLRLAAAGTAVVIAVGAIGVASADLARTVLTPVSFVLGGLGVVLFLWSYFAAVERSRSSEIAVAQLYVVSGTVAPRPVKRLLRWTLWIQITAAVVVMVVGFGRTDPEEFNWAATAIVTPLFGFGVNGMWVARHGTFGPRILTPRTRRRSPQKHESRTEMEQNPPHG